jgi:hypothetical protein
MAAVPIYVWNGTAWQETGPTIPASPIKYQASAPSSPSTGDIWVDSDADVTSGSQQFQRFRFVASGGETTISGNDANGATLAYTAGAELVVLNGSTLVRGQDYTATNGTSITGLSPALVANDVLEVFSFIAFNVANTYTQSQVDGLLNDYMGMRLIVPTSVSSGSTISSTGAVTFTSASTVELNGIFSSTYQNYKVILTITANSASATTRLRMRSGSTNAAGSNYARAGYYNYASGSSGALNQNGVTSMDIGNQNSAAAGRNIYTFEFANPFLAQETTATGSWATQDTAGFIWGGFSFLHDLAVSYNGLAIIADSGTISGSVRVYGYKN